MKKISLLLLLALALPACRQAEDTRFFAPELSFETDTYTVPSADGGVDVVVALSRPAPVAFQVGLILSGSLQEGLQYSVPSHTLDVAQGDSRALLHVTIVDDEIWEDNLSLDILLTPGSRYTIDPGKNCSARVQVTKRVVIPVLQLALAEEDQEVNPYLAPSIALQLKADKAPLTDVTVPLAVEGLTPGEDFLIDGSAEARLILPAGQTLASGDLQILKKDQAGYEGRLTFSISSKKGQYGVGNEGASVSIRLYDPVPNLKPLWRYSHAGGYTFRQGIKKVDGEWDNGTMAGADMGPVGSDGCYITGVQSFRTDYYNCNSIDIGGHILRLNEFVPNVTLLNYGKGSNTRPFTPVDSLLRFVLDPGSATQGRLMLDSPREFRGYYGSKTDWEAASPSDPAWAVDSRKTGGRILQSESPILTGYVKVVLQKLEGRFDLTSSTEPLLFTAWFSCDDDRFMQGVDLTTWDIVQENGLWKVQYKLWPR